MSLWSLLEDAFFHYVKSKNLQKVKQFAEFFPFIFTKPEIFNFVTENNCIDTISLFLENGAQPNLKDLETFFKYHNYVAMKLTYQLTNVNLHAIVGDRFYHMFVNELEKEDKLFCAMHK